MKKKIQYATLIRDWTYTNMLNLMAIAFAGSNPAPTTN